VARAQRANRMCGNLDFASAASDPRDSECIVGQPEGIRVPRRGSVLRSRLVGSNLRALYCHLRIADHSSFKSSVQPFGNEPNDAIRLLTEGC